MAQLAEIVQYLNQLLDPSAFSDSSYNGLQVDAGIEDVTRLAVAVDGGQSIIEKAIKLKAQLLLVHHGIIWGNPGAVNGSFGKKVRTLIEGRCSLYAAHLPLDAHPEYGNNSQLAGFFNLTDWQPFCEFEGRKIGIKGVLGGPTTIDAIIQRCKDLPGAARISALPYGPAQILRVGIVSGSAASAIFPAAEEGLDLLITGEARHETYHAAKELKMNVIFAGHYATETLGVLALKMQLEKDFSIGTVFIDEPTGI